MRTAVREGLLSEAASSARKAMHLVYLVRAATDGLTMNDANLLRLKRAAQHLADAECGVLQILKENT